jgi:hypothetical protein
MIDNVQVLVTVEVVQKNDYTRKILAGGQCSVSGSMDIDGIISAVNDCASRAVSDSVSAVYRSLQEPLTDSPALDF